MANYILSVNIIDEYHEALNKLKLLTNASDADDLLNDADKYKYSRQKRTKKKMEDDESSNKSDDGDQRQPPAKRSRKNKNKNKPTKSKLHENTDTSSESSNIDSPPAFNDTLKSQNSITKIPKIRLTSALNDITNVAKKRGFNLEFNKFNINISHNNFLNNLTH